MWWEGFPEKRKNEKSKIKTSFYNSTAYPVLQWHAAQQQNVKEAPLTHTSFPPKTTLFKVVGSGGPRRGLPMAQKARAYKSPIIWL